MTNRKMTTTDNTMMDAYYTVNDSFCTPGAGLAFSTLWQMHKSDETQRTRKAQH